MKEGEGLRLFVAIELGEHAKFRLEEVAASMSTTIAPGLRTVMPGGFHLTIKFLGEVKSKKVVEVVSAAAKAAVVSPFLLKLGSVGAFPNERRPQVLWIGITGALEPLKHLHYAVEETMHQLGFAKEARPFQPHLTVARFRRRANHSVRTGTLHTLRSRWRGEGTTFEARSLAVVQSVLGSSGAEYTRIASVPMVGTAL